METTERRGATETHPQTGAIRRAGCCGPGALWGWSPPPMPADTPLKRDIDRFLPRSGLPAVVFFAVIIALLNVGLILPTRADLTAVGLASLGGGTWCWLNFWRSRHAHCVVTGTGWLALAAFTFLEAGLGHSLIEGDEGLVFLAVLAAGLAFEGVWFLVRRTNAMTSCVEHGVHARSGLPLVNRLKST